MAGLMAGILWLYSKVIDFIVLSAVLNCQPHNWVARRRIKTSIQFIILLFTFIFIIMSWKREMDKISIVRHPIISTAFFFNRFSANRVFYFAETLSFLLEFWVFHPWVLSFFLELWSILCKPCIFCLKSFWNLEKWSNFIIFLLKAA